MLWPPLVFASIGSILVFHQASRMKKLGKAALAFGFFIYILFGFIGELINHLLFPKSFEGIGDNPSQIGFLIITIFVSVIIVPLLYTVMKKQKPTDQPPAS